MTSNWALNCESLNSLNRYRSKLFAIEILRLNKYFNIFFKTKKRGYMEIVLRPARSSIRIIVLILNCSGSRLYDLWFFPIFSFKQTRGGSYHRSYKLDKERVSLSPKQWHVKVQKKLPAANFMVHSKPLLIEWS